VIVDSDDDDVMPPGCDIDYDDMLLMPRSMADNEPCRHPKKPRKEESFKKPKEQHQPVFFKQSNSVTLKQQQESFQQKKQEQPRPVSLKQPKKQETVPPKHPKKQEPVLQSVSNKQPVLMPRRYEEDVYVENMEKYPAVEYLKPFQVEALEKIREMPVSFVTWAPGSGKTILAIRVAVDCLEKKLVKQVTVIAPLSLHGNIFR
jgi:phosphate starvation-inducible protein PhoH